MSYNPSYTPGDWKAVCQVCGRIFKGSQIRKRWDGLNVCSEDWEAKHEQLYVRGVKDDQRPPFTVPEPVDSFVSSIGGYWAFDPKTDIDTCPVGTMDAYTTPSGSFIQDRLVGGQCYVEHTT